MRKIYAIILSWNNYNDTKECIASLLSSDYPIHSAIIIDNGSQDNSVEMLYKQFREDHRVHFLLNESNLGFAAGINPGIQAALKGGADYIFIVNNDAIVHPQAIGHLIKAAEEEKSAGIVGPRIFYRKSPERIWLGGGYFSYLKAGVIVPEKNKLVKSFSLEKREVSFLTGCAMLIRREVFERIGLFDEDYFFYCEDLDFCLRARRAGFKILYVPEAKAWHKIENITKDRTTPFVLYHLARSNILFLRKNFSVAYFLYGLLIHLLVFTPWRIIQIIKGSRSLASFMAWWKGTWAGLTTYIGGHHD